MSQLPSIPYMLPHPPNLCVYNPPPLLSFTTHSLSATLCRPSQCVSPRITPVMAVRALQPDLGHAASRRHMKASREFPVGGRESPL
ncbi:hypothetical protein PBY51_025012 [Eleginops maclovinus]|uniref:Uncharacterized protein n=1 Tax=Eleginops maclovinus TaxID=56733 RepID=A0AAN7Y246_ELEMC|nr:hypothetical protein PBY51_025012 [Eleginops maclovinus]